MKSELFFEALPVRASEIDERGPSARLGIVSLLLFLVVGGGIALCWKQGSAALLSMKSDDELLQDELSLLQENREAVFDLRVSSCADYLCFRSPAGNVHRVNVSAIGTGEVQTNLFPGRYSEELQLSPVADQMAVSFLDKTVVLQSLDPSLSSQVLLDKTPEVVDCLAYSPDGRLLAGSSLKGLVFVWDVESGNRVAVLRRANDQVMSLVFDSEMGLLVSFESGIERWQIDPNRKSRDRRRLDWKLTRNSTAREIVVSPEGRFLIVGTFSGLLEVWDLPRREKLWEQAAKSQTVRGLIVSQESNSVFCFSGEKAFMEYDLLTGSERLLYHDPRIGSGTSSGFSRRGDLIYSGCTDGFIRIWSLQENVVLGKIDTATL